MITLKILKEMVHALGDVSEAPHFERTAFRLPTGKMRKGQPVTKIFASYDAKAHRACLKLSTEDQDLFSLHDPIVIYPVPNKWGKQGWTNVELSKVRKGVLKDALKAAMRECVP